MAQNPRRAFRMEVLPWRWASFVVADSLGPGAPPSSRTARGAPPHGWAPAPYLFEHVLVGEPASTSPEHALCRRRACELRQGVAECIRDRGRARLAVLDGGPDPHLHAFEHQARFAIA